MLFTVQIVQDLALEMQLLDNKDKKYQLKISNILLLWFYGFCFKKLI
jgi:hypothetical protein